MSSVQSAIIGPAISLAHKLQLSVDKYTVWWSPHHRLRLEERPSMPYEFSNFECINLLRSGQTLKFPVQGRILTYMFDVTPGLFLEPAKAETFADPKVLKRPKILVAATQEEAGPYRPSVTRQGESATLLGWLEEKAYAKHTLGYRYT